MTWKEIKYKTGVLAYVLSHLLWLSIKFMFVRNSISKMIDINNKVDALEKKLDEAFK